MACDACRRGKIAAKCSISLHRVAGQMKGQEIRLFLMSRIMIPIWLCSLPIHSPGLYAVMVCDASRF